MNGRVGACLRILSHGLAVAALAVLVASGVLASAVAHPLGNFTINQYSRLTIGANRIDLRYVIDMAEISTLQELQKLGSGSDGKPTESELDQDLSRIVADYVGNLVLVVDGERVPLAVNNKSISLPPGAGGLPTLRIEASLVGIVPASPGETVRHLSFEDRNRRERIGWREIIVGGAAGTTIADSSAYGNGLTDELKAYPLDMLAAPLREEAASLSFTQGAPPAGAVPLRTRDGHLVMQARDPVTDLINVAQLTPLAAFLGLLVAAGFGAFHAFSPGHGKTVVGAYLIGARASMKHAVFLGITVTVTHTLGVLALGVVTLFASQYILPEQLFPVLSFISGAIVFAMGLSLFVARLRAARDAVLNGHRHVHRPHRGHDHAHQDHAHHDHAHQDHGHRDHGHRDHRHDHGPMHAGPAALAHAHGGREHSHLPPGADGSPIRWRSLFALGVSGGLLPCPSALVILLSAIALHRVAYGLFLVVAFSFGLAATLTGIGLAFIHAGRWIKRPTGPRIQGIGRVLPAASAFVIMAIGAGICGEALVQAGQTFPTLLAGVSSVSSIGFTAVQLSVALVSLLAVLALGLMLALKRG